MRLVEVIASPENPAKLPAIGRGLDSKNLWPIRHIVLVTLSTAPGDTPLLWAATRGGQR